VSERSELGLRQEARGDALVLTLDRPARRNSLTPALAGALGAAVEAAPDAGARVVVVTGAGGAFCAGGDLDALEAVAVDGGAEAVMTAIYGNFHRLALAIRRSPLPVVALVDGPALGAGLDLALVCDLRVGTTAASFASSWIRMGLVPGMGGAYLLPSVVGAGPAAELLLTGATLDAERALALGLLSSVDEPGEVWATVDERVAQLAALPAVALAQTKASLRRGTDDGYERELATLGATQGALLTGPAFRAAAEAFRSRARSTTKRS
jgi:2-(1,2-epoxy-1,2-dihydrophenyl)acetyl-CoA isomerase